MGKTLTFILGALTVIATVCQGLRAQSTQNEFLPETNAYWTISPIIRLEVLVARTKDGDTFDSATTGSGLDFFMKPLSSKRRTNEDESNGKLLTIGVTYRYIGNVDKANENRLQFDGAPKYPLPKDMLLADRNRLELRIIMGDVTWRYRNRLTFQKTIQLGRLKLTPYARAEGFYEINQSKWSEVDYSFGGFIPLTRRIEIEPYYQGEYLYGATSSHVNAVGVTVAFYFRKSAARKGKN